MALVTAQRAPRPATPALVTGNDAIRRDGFSYWNVFQRLDGQRPGFGYDSHGTSHTQNLKLSGCLFSACPDELEPRQHSLVVLEPTVLSLDSFGRCYAHAYRTDHDTAKASPGSRGGSLCRATAIMRSQWPRSGTCPSAVAGICRNSAMACCSTGETTHCNYCGRTCSYGLAVGWALLRRLQSHASFFFDAQSAGNPNGSGAVPGHGLRARRCWIKL